MIDAFFDGGSLPFSIAILIMFGLLLIELAALITGVGINDLIDEFVVSHIGIETIGDAPTGMETTGAADAGSMVGRFLAWLYIGRVPVLMLLIIFLTVFGLGGLVLQAALLRVTGSTLPSIVAAPIVLVATIPILRGCAGFLARWMPRDESSAVDPATFVGHTAIVTGGTARSGLPAQARLTDSFGTDHYVLVEPEDDATTLETGSRVLLLRQTAGGRFAAIISTNPALHDD